MFRAILLSASTRQRRKMFLRILSVAEVWRVASLQCKWRDGVDRSVEFCNPVRSALVRQHMRVFVAHIDGLMALGFNSALAVRIWHIFVDQSTAAWCSNHSAAIVEATFVNAAASAS